MQNESLSTRSLFFFFFKEESQGRRKRCAGVGVCVWGGQEVEAAWQRHSLGFPSPRHGKLWRVKGAFPIRGSRGLGLLHLQVNPYRQLRIGELPDPCSSPQTGAWSQAQGGEGTSHRERQGVCQRTAAGDRSLDETPGIYHQNEYYLGKKK